MRRLAVFVGKFALFLASMAFLTALSLFIVGAYLATMPVLRLSPRNKRVQAATGAAVAIVALIRAYGKGDTPEPEPEPVPLTYNPNTGELAGSYPYPPDVYVSLLSMHHGTCALFSLDPDTRATGCTCGAARTDA